MERNAIMQEKFIISPPDGGWGWIIVFVSFLNTAMSASLASSYGLLFSSIFAEHHVSSITSAWIFNINQLIWCISILFGAPLCLQFSLRIVAFYGGLLISISVLLCQFISEPAYLFILYSWFAGLGQGLVAIVSSSIVPLYFNKKRGRAIGVSLCGSCMGQCVGSLLVKYLLEQYGFKGTTLILGAIFFHICVGSLLYHPVDWHSTRSLQEQDEREMFLENLYDAKCSTKREIEIRENLHALSLSLTSLDTVSVSGKKFKISRYLGSSQNNKTQVIKKNTSNEISFLKKLVNIIKLVLSNLALFKWHRVKLISITVALVIASYVNFVMLVPFAMLDAGYSLEMVSWSMTTSGISNIVTRIVITTMTDIFPYSTKYYFMGGVFLIFISIFAFSFTTSFETILITMFFVGIGAGSCMSIISIIILEFMGLELLPKILGMQGLIIGTFFIVVGPVIGTIRDATASFTITFRILAIIPLISFFLWFLMNKAIASDLRRGEQSKNESSQSVEG